MAVLGAVFAQIIHTTSFAATLLYTVKVSEMVSIFALDEQHN